MKLFGSLCHTSPASVLSEYRHFVACLFSAAVAASADNSLCLIAIDTIGFIGKSPEGKLALDKEGIHIVWLTHHFFLFLTF